MSGPGPWLELWLSSARFGVYLAAARDDRALALDLYEWNATVSSGLQHDLAHLEVALRNAYDVALAASSEPGRPHWTRDARRLFPVSLRRVRDGSRIDQNKRPRDQIDSAVMTAGANAPEGKVIAELTFGFWRYLSTKAHDQRLWIPYLHKAFVAGTSRQQVDRPIEQLHTLRNRVAHHEPVFRQDLAQRHEDLLTVAGLISSDLRAYILAHSRVPALIGERPSR